jgi:hypothetical protein
MRIVNLTPKVADYVAKPVLTPSKSTKHTASILLGMRIGVCFVALLLAFSPTGAYAQAAAKAPEFTSIVVFGDSLSDTGNVAHLTYDKYGARIPGPAADYTDGRFTDGFDTLPPAQL